MLYSHNRFAALGLVLFAILPLDSCDLLGGLGSSTIEVQLGSIFQLSIGQTALLPMERLSIRFTGVFEDSRCPVDVQCVWAGNAKVTLDVSQTGKARQAVTLNSNLEPREVVYEGFRIRFEGLMPHPISTQPIRREDYRLSLSASK